MTYQTLTTYNNKFPQEGPKTIPREFEFAGAGSQAINFLEEFYQKKVTVLQGVFFNNVGGANSRLICAITGQVIQLKAGAQGSVMLLVTGVPEFVLESDGAGKTLLQFVNFPVNTHIF